MSIRQRMAKRRKEKLERRFLYCFEGIAGTGKTSMIKIVRQDLKDYYGRPIKVRISSIIPKRKEESRTRMSRRLFPPATIPAVIPAVAAIGLERMTKKKGVTLFDRSPMSLIASDIRLKKKSDVEKAARKWAEFYKEKSINTIFLFKIDPKLAEKRILARAKPITPITIYEKAKTLEGMARRYEIARKVFEKEGYDIRVIEIDEKTKPEDVAKQISEQIKSEIRAKVLPTKTS